MINIMVLDGTISIQFTLADLSDIAKALLPHIHQHKIVAFHGQMGVGKTTLIKTICQTMGVKEMVNSPTFAIINEYKSPYGSIFHTDWYRLNDVAEARNAGVEDTLYSNAICLIEWPEKFPELLPNNTLNIYLSVISKEKRGITYMVKNV
jgi:tRNA threonylcarbamoyladenosine biosynthesis protein TsaE